MNNLETMCLTYILFTLCGSLIFKKFIYIFAFGNPLATLLVPILSFIIIYFEKTQISNFSYFQGLLLVLYGLRLILVFCKRMKIWKNWSNEADVIIKKMKDKNNNAVYSLWLTMGISGVFMVSPFNIGLIYKEENMFFNCLGFLIAIFGLIFEEISDIQKANFKTKYPEEFCNTGLYKKIRRPNYLGEIIFWFGLWFSSVPCYINVLIWIYSTSGFLILFFIMVNASQRLDKKQKLKYGEKFEVYYKNTRMLL